METVIDTDGQTLTKTTYESGTIEYYNIKGERHRIGGPAYIGSDGTLEYWVDGKLHRIGGPAYIGSIGTQFYYVDDKRHRTDGPAVIYPDGIKVYYVDGFNYTEAEYPKAVIEYKLKQLVG